MRRRYTRPGDPGGDIFRPGRGVPAAPTDENDIQRSQTRYPSSLNLIMTQQSPKPFSPGAPKIHDDVDRLRKILRGPHDLTIPANPEAPPDAFARTFPFQQYHRSALIATPESVYRKDRVCTTLGDNTCCCRLCSLIPEDVLPTIPVIFCHDSDDSIPVIAR